MFKKSFFIFKNNYRNQIKCIFSYKQGQILENNIREYFYFIDHQGMLFLDDSKMKNFTSCFKDKKFLQFFFKRLQINDTNQYQNEFPYVSKCGPELNFVRCDDLPIVFTEIIYNDEKGKFLFSHNNGGHLLVEDFQANKLLYFPNNGRMYHPTKLKYGGIGLVCSKLVLEFSKQLIYENDTPCKFVWQSKEYILDQEWYKPFTKNIQAKE